MNDTTTALVVDRVSIERAGPADQPVLIAFMGELQMFEAMLTENRADPRDMAEKHVAALTEWAERCEGGFLVARLGGAIIGFVVYGVEEEFGYFVAPQFQRCGRISDLYVEPNSREAGVGRMLIAAAEDQLRAIDVRRAEITTLAGNIESRSFYETLNYKSYQVQYAKAL